MVIKDDRNMGIDALRILAMFMVVIIHMIENTQILSIVDKKSSTYFSVKFLEAMVFCAVNCYGIISGYVGQKKKLRIKNILVLWIQVEFYMWIYTFIDCVIEAKPPSYNDILYSLFPVIHGRYWYFTAYFALFFFMPLINSAVEVLSKKEISVSIFMMTLLFSVFPTAFDFGLLGDYAKDPFLLNRGLSFFWLTYLYVIGAFLFKHKPFENMQKKKRLLMCISIYSIGVFVTWILIRAKSNFILLNYTSPTILFCGIALVELFSNIRIKRFKTAILSFSSSTFGVYLIHENIFFKVKIMRLDILKHIVEHSTFIVVFLILLCSTVIFTVCSLIDRLRNKIFEVCRIKKKACLLETKILRIFDIIS